MCVKWGVLHVKQMCWRSCTIGLKRDRSQSPVGLFLCFLWTKHEERGKSTLSKPSALKQPRVTDITQNTHMLGYQGYSLVIQQHVTEILCPISCGNLGIWEWGFGRERAGIMICLCSCLGHEWHGSAPKENSLDMHMHKYTQTCYIMP